MGGTHLSAGDGARRGALLSLVQAPSRTSPTALVTPGLVAGLVLFAAVLAHQGVRDVTAALAVLGANRL